MIDPVAVTIGNPQTQCQVNGVYKAAKQGLFAGGAVSHAEYKILADC